MGRVMTTGALQSNYLTDLAGRIRIEHEAVSTALKDSVRHAITAGELLIEAKKQLAHGQWLPWLADHCTIAERTAQLYMRCARNREAIENQIRNGVADLSLNEAAAMLMLTSDVRKLLAFAGDCEALSGEALVDRCIAEGVGVIVDEGYDPFAGRSETEQLEWMLFQLFVSCDPSAHRAGMQPQHAAYHIEWVLQRPFQNVAEWLGDEGERFRRVNGSGLVSEEFKSDWAAFLDQHRDWPLDRIVEKLTSLQQEVEKGIADGRLVDLDAAKSRRKRRTMRGAP
jgi:hypothetical protein